MAIDNFTLITGVGGLVGLGIQFLDIFPKHGNVRHAIGFVLVGIFIGCLIRGVDPARVAVSMDIGLSGVVVFAFMAVIGGCLLAAGVTESASKRSDFMAVSGIAAGLFMLVLGAIAITHSPAVADADAHRPTIAELILLSDTAEQRGDDDRAISHLEMAAAQMKTTQDSRLPAIEQRIERLKALEISSQPKK